MSNTPWYREFDLAYWQMREALGYPIPDRIDRRFPRKPYMGKLISLGAARATRPGFVAVEPWVWS